MTYTLSDVTKIRETAFGIAFHLASKHDVFGSDESSMLGILRYAEDIAQTYMQADITPEEFEECLKEMLRQ